MRRRGRKKWFFVVAALALLGVGAWFLTRSTPDDTRCNGAYRLDDGRWVFITPREGEVLRYRMMSGESRALWPVGEGRYEAGPGWSGRQPVEVTLTFVGDGGVPDGFRWEHADFGSQRARRVELPERIVHFDSGELDLRGKLTLPLGPGPHPVAVLVHGSGRESAVDTYYNAYLFASHGIASFVYDKRGTGESTGSYLQYFPALADDVVAAVEWLREQPEIDASKIHLAGYSQGGWIAPLAASKTDGIRSLLIGYGPMVPITGEDRWGYVYALEKQGFGEAAIARADRINDVLSDIVDRRADRWGELKREVEAARGEDWFEALKGSDSMLGFVADTWMPWWVIRVYAWWMMRPREVPFVDRTYDPVPTLAGLDVPSLWIFGGEDHSMPTGWTVDELEKLQAAGRPITVETFPEADHGILAFEESDTGERTFLGYSEGYLPLQVDWLREQSGLPALGG